MPGYKKLNVFLLMHLLIRILILLGCHLVFPGDLSSGSPISVLTHTESEYYRDSYTSKTPGKPSGESNETHGILCISDCNNLFGRDDNLALGNPGNSTENPKTPDNYLIRKPQFVMSYNNSRGIPNWVSWHLSESWTGSAKRCDCFKPDDQIPSTFYKVKPSDYSGSGFDKGHLCPSADRDGSDSDNEATFLMTNMMPQAPKNNQVTWNRLEAYCRNLTKQGHELYIVAGAYGSGGTGKNGGVTYNLADGKITVPARTWKIILVLPLGSDDLKRINQLTRVIAVDMPNNQTVSSQPWHYYRTSVDRIEKETGLNIFSLVPPKIQEIIESSIDKTPIQKTKKKPR